MWRCLLLASREAAKGTARVLPCWFVEQEHEQEHEQEQEQEHEHEHEHENLEPRR